MAQTKAQLLGPVVGDVVMDVSTLSLDAEGNKVGIGTTGATATLHVFEPTEGDAVVQFNSGDNFPSVNRGLVIKSATGPSGYAGSKWIFDAQSSGGRIEFQTTSSPRLTILESGNVGVGEDNPDVRLHIKEQFDTAYSLTSVATDTNHLLKLENPSTTANAFAGIQFRVGSGADLYFGAIQQSVNHGDFFFANQNSPNAELMRIKSSGNVGIGTDNPNTKLQIVTTSGARALTVTAPTLGPYIVFETNTTPFADIGSEAGLVGSGSNTDMLTLNARGSRSLSFRTNSNERLRIDSDGRILINLTSSLLSYAGLQVKADADLGAHICLANKTAAPTSGHNIGSIRFTNNAGGIGAIIGVEGDGTWSSGSSHPSRMLFATTAAGDVGATQRLLISSAGDITLGYGGTSLHFQNGFNNSTARIQNGGGSNSSELKFLVKNAGTESEKMRLTSTAGLAIVTAGSMPANAGNETLYVMGEGHNGHGTSNTRSVVSIIGALSSNGNAAGVWMGARTNDNTAVIGTRTASGHLAFETYNGGWGERLRLTNTGRFGINVSSPEDPLHVKNSSNAATTVRIQTGKTSTSNGDEYASIIFDGYSYTGAKIASCRDDGTWDDRGDLRFYSGYGNNVFTERMRITNTGLVAIGADAYGNVAPLAKLHVSSTGTTTAIGTNHNNLRSSCQILCQASDNADNSKSGIMFSGALHSTDGCSAAVVANHESVGENTETTSLSFYTSHNESLKESLKITSDSQFETNGVRNIYQSFILANSTSYNWDFTVPDEGGYGNSFYLVAGYNHYYTTNYGAHRTVWFSARGTSVNSMGNGIEQYHSQSGSWTFSKPNATTVRITKTGGTYAGSGYGFFHLMYNHF